MIKIGLCGYTGKIGQEIKNLLANDIETTYKESMTYIGGINKNSSESDLKNLLKVSDVVIDFSNVETLENLLKFALEMKCSLVIGTTGYSEKQMQDISNASKTIPILYSANMTIVPYLAAKLASIASHVLGSEYDIEICETHHRMKVDAPSGTALMMAKEIAKSKNLNSNSIKVESINGLRAEDRTIGITSIRGGGVRGYHEIMFLGKEDSLVIKTDSFSRSSFAIGAIKAAKWISNKKPGLYSVLDVHQLNM